MQEPLAPAAPERVYTPRHLADKILRSRSALQGERRQVTVLFADVAGFTSLAETLAHDTVTAIAAAAPEASLADTLWRWPRVQEMQETVERVRRFR